ncbi:hypothetical protein TYRP_014921 [Tyrophagus putrescentiae]|nr:hypothetical protein TYRP_014921 [Tyrophagus putrescentiae]
MEATEQSDSPVEDTQLAVHGDIGVAVHQHHQRVALKADRRRRTSLKDCPSKAVLSARFSSLKPSSDWPYSTSWWTKRFSFPWGNSSLMVPTSPTTSRRYVSGLRAITSARLALKVSRQ